MTTTRALPRTPTGAQIKVVFGRGLNGAWTLAEEVAYRAAVIGVTWPVRTGAALAALPVLPVWSWNTTTGLVLGTSALLIGRGEIRARISSLTDLSRSRGRRTRIQTQWTRVCADLGLVKTGRDKIERAPRIVRIEDTAVGHVLTVDAGSVSKSTSAFMSKSQDIRTGLGAKDITITPDGHMTRVHLIYTDILSRVHRAKDMPAPSRPHTVVSGVDSYGDPVEESPYAHQLLVGESGSGKSSKIWRLIQALQDAGIPHRVRVFDPKDGVEFGDLEDVAYQYESNPRALPDMLTSMFRSHSARAADMKRRGVRRLSTATDEDPLDILIIDELITALKMNAGKAGKVRVQDTGMDTADALLQYLSVGAATLHHVWACTQLGQKETLGTLADMFPAKTLLRVPSDDLARVVFKTSGGGTFPAHLIPRGNAGNGIGYTFTEAKGVVKYRAAYLSDTDRAKVVKRMGEDTAKWRERWPL